MQHWSRLTASSILTFASLILITSAQDSLDPNSVPSSTRNTWCQGNQQACSIICSAGTSVNTCDVDELTYECTCNGGTSPDLSQYALTLPYFICLELRSQCIANNANNLSGQAECNQGSCAATNPSAAAAAGTSTTTTASLPAGAPGGFPSSTSETPAETQNTVAQGGGAAAGTPDSSISTSTTPVVEETQPTTSLDTRSTTSQGPSTTNTTPSSSTSNGPTIEETGAGNPGDGGNGKKGLSTGAIIGIAVGVGVPVLLGLLFLAYKWGGRRATDPPVLAPAFVSPQSQWQGGNEIAGGGGDPGIGHGNEIGGIQDQSYGASGHWGPGRQY
ncbi:hypothetical protein TWF481_006159 [Arthrobotrys musiformis]|uniref:DUF7707 domain-containing protein n=1 Tax=Arthrobotrys musiformis TaxID=47236 RepID=A0AAV9WHU8_9PEZI